MELEKYSLADIVQMTHGVWRLVVHLNGPKRPKLCAIPRPKIRQLPITWYATPGSCRACFPAMCRNKPVH